MTFVVTGEDGRADEDIACAEYIARLVTREPADASGSVDRALRSPAAAALTDGVGRGCAGVHHPGDVRLCTMVDVFPFAMVAAGEGGLMTPRPVAVPPRRRPGSSPAQ
ncbi:hypothetical protein [Streptomyces sp. NPDC018347]|uniref:hypothetical protein n=1 Tax=Streptomyces sp. NPDC018347 TaxID=3157193 RepID=UPI0033CA30F1